LTPGTRLGIYDVLAVIGAGGMGEVYRARDTKLQRDVALKVLPDAFVRDPDRLARFKREAQLLAALNHPNIAAIFGLEESVGTPALVLELVDGATLADRMAEGPVPLDETVAIATQIADALESAHEQGIVHRDLKPANIKVRPDGTVKVLDFGLAKAIEGTGSAAAGGGGSHDVTNSPTITSPAMTHVGMILGTAAYMSPEQAKGRTADRRSDIWAFGVVLYEMLSGEHAFKGDDVADTLAAVLRAEPAWTALPANTPSSIQRLLRRCLQKNPKHRLQHIGDARLELADVDGASAVVASAPRPSSRRPLWTMVAAAVAGGALVGLVGSMFTPARVAPPVTRFSIPMETSAALATGPNSSMALSPDGRTLVYLAGGTRPGLERRRLSDATSEPIRGAEGGSRPFFSPDGEWIGFFAEGKVKKIPAAGGQPVIIADAPPAARATWGDDGTIVMARPGLSWVASSGGTPVEIFGADEGQFYEPELLPGSKVVLVESRRPPNPGYIEAVALETRSRHRLLEGSSPRLAPTGELLFVRQGRIWAVRFDATRLAVVGSPLPVVESVGLFDGGAPENVFATSRDGSLVYLSGSSSGSPVWIDRTGRATPAVDEPLELRNPRLSPDGARMAANGLTPPDVWIVDLARGSRLRLTTDGHNRGAVWSPDGQRVAFFSAPQMPQSGDVSQDLFVAPAVGGARRRLLERPGAQWPVSWSPDGRSLIFEDGPGFSRDLWLLPLGEDPRPLAVTRFNERGGVFSPDGRSIAFVTDESGRDEVYVQPFPDAGQKVPISTNGGLQPVWSRDGRELFYRDGDSLMAVAIQRAPFRAGAPRKLFDLPGALYDLNPYSADYDVAADGRFLSIRRETTADMHVVLNWVEELRRALAADGTSIRTPN
jgi:eukaryotic-like serine/threonine-protein kinase